MTLHQTKSDPDTTSGSDARKPARIFLLLVLLVFMSGMLHTALPLLRSYVGIVWGDAYTYVTTARHLVRGSVYMDGPLAELIAAQERPNTKVWEPIWNHSVRPDGKTVSTMSLAYPLFLATMLRLGGTWLFTHANLFLLWAVMILTALVVWEGLDRTRHGAVIGAIVGLLLPWTQLATFSQFAYLWREPLFYLCLMGGCYAFLRFLHTGHMRWLPILGFSLGYACSIKEANAVYLACFGVLFLLAHPWKSWRHFGHIMLLGGAFFLLGLTPILIQNLISTGNPLVSLQTLRETSQYSFKGDKGFGLSSGNVPQTLRMYMFFYSMNPWFIWPLLAIALAGMLVTWRSLLTRLLAGLAALHILLYLQWGNADLRYSFWLHIPYLAFLALGVYAPFAWMGRKWPKLVPVGYALGLAAVVTTAAWPTPWRSATDSGKPRFRYGNAIRLAREIRATVAPRHLILVNRSMREVLATYSDLSLVRLQDLPRLRQDRDVRRIVDQILSFGIHLYFLDNVDQDPRNAGKIDWGRKDLAFLMEHYHLDALKSFPSDAYHLGTLVNQDALHLYAVSQLHQTGGLARCVVPRDGAAFFHAFYPLGLPNPILSAGTQRLVRLNHADSWIPTFDRAFSGTVDIAYADKQGLPVATLWDAHWVGWNEDIQIDIGADAIPPDAGVFPQGLEKQPDAFSRYTTNSFHLRVPVRQRADCFSVFSFGLVPITEQLFQEEQVVDDSETNIVILIRDSNGREHEVISMLNYTWAPYYLPRVTNDWSGFEELDLYASPALRLKLNGLESRMAFTSTRYHLPEDRVAAVLTGRLIPRTPGTNEISWTVQVNGRIHESGRCTPDPRRTRNIFHLVMESADGTRDFQVDFTPVGLMETAWTNVGEAVSLAPGEKLFAPLSSGFFDTESVDGKSVAWTQGHTLLRVPLMVRENDYRLILHARDGHPGELREATLTLGKVTQRIRLPDQAEDLVVDFKGLHPDHDGLADLVMEVPTWNPSFMLDSLDTRNLGFQLFRFTWQPLP